MVLLAIEVELHPEIGFGICASGMEEGGQAWHPF